MPKWNKAHTATVNRIVRRYGGTLRLDGHCDLHTPHGLVGVETGATVGRRIRHLEKHAGPAYVAVTNKESLSDALRAAKGSRIGVMDPQGNIVKPAECGRSVERSRGKTKASHAETPRRGEKLARR